MLTQPWQLKLTWHEHVACHICLRIILILHENLKDLYNIFNTSGTKVILGPKLRDTFGYFAFGFCSVSSLLLFSVSQNKASDVY